MASQTVMLYTLVDKGLSLGLDTYPIFNENYRETLNSNIINAYMDYEIAFETYLMFEHKMSARMALIMPMYNKLYETEAMQYDPLLWGVSEGESSSIVDSQGNSQSTGISDASIKSESGSVGIVGDSGKVITNGSVTASGSDITTSVGDKNSNAKQNSSSDSRVVDSDAPQNQLQSGVNPITDMRFASTAKWGLDKQDSATNDSETHSSTSTVKHGKVDTTSNTNTTSSEQNSTSTDSSETSSVAGSENATTTKNATNGNTKTKDKYNNVDPAISIANYRKNLVNIDMMIIEELHDLFFGLM